MNFVKTCPENFVNLKQSLVYGESVLTIRIENCPDTGLSIRNLMAFPLIMYRKFV